MGHGVAKTKIKVIGGAVKLAGSRAPVTLFVPGIPRPKGSIKGWAIKRGGHYTGQVASAQDNPKTRSWEGVLATVATAKGVHPFAFPRPVEVSLIFFFPRPMSHFFTGKRAGELRPDNPLFPVHKKKNDLDKLERAALDGLDGVAYEDDAQVVTFGRSGKRWAKPPHGPGVLIRVEEAKG